LRIGIQKKGRWLPRSIFQKYNRQGLSERLAGFPLEYRHDEGAQRRQAYALVAGPADFGRNGGRRRGLWRSRRIALENALNAYDRLPPCFSIWPDASLRMAGTSFGANSFFFATFAAFMGWRGAAVATPLYLLSHACALVVARRLAREQPWLSSERSTGAFLAGAVLAPPIPALLGSVVLPLVGLRISSGATGVPAAIDSWIRGGAATLAVVPAILVYCFGPLKTWIGLPPERYFQSPVDRRRVLELSVETAMCTATLWISVRLKAHYPLDRFFHRSKSRNFAASHWRSGTRPAVASGSSANRKLGALRPRSQLQLPCSVNRTGSAVASRLLVPDPPRGTTASTSDP
jgi:hypothetical protein